MTYWTLTNNGVEKSFADWGLENVVITKVSQSIGGMTCVASNQNAGSAPLFPKGSLCYIKRDRVLNTVTNTYSGGSQFFVGRMVKPKHRGQPGGESIAYSIAGLWWYFENLPFEQYHREYSSPNGTFCSGPTSDTCAPGYTTDGRFEFRLTRNPAVVLNQNYFGEKLTAAQQIREILDWLIANDAPFTYDAGQIDAEFSSIELSTNELPDATCALALITELAWIPDCETWFDYSTPVPTFRVRRRASLTSHSLDINDGDAIGDFNINERDELQRSQVIIKFRVTNSVDGQTWQQFVEDKYPASPAVDDPFSKLKQTVDLVGFAGTNQIAEVETEDFPDDLNSTAWWQNQAQLKWLQDVTISKIHGAVRTGEQSLPRILKDGVLADWMLEDNAPVVTEEVAVNAKMDFVLPDGTVRKNESISVALKSTNAKTRTYSAFALSQISEPVPTGLAQQIYEALALPQYEGSLSLIAEEVQQLIDIGTKVSFSGGHADWETAQAPIKSVTYDIDNGTVSATFGVNRYLNAGELVDLMRVSRQRRLSALTVSRATAQAGGNSGVVSGKKVPNRNSSSGAARTQVQVIAENDNPTIGNVIKHDAAGGASTWQTSNGLVTVAPAFGQHLFVQELEGCDRQTGQRMFCLTIRSPWRPEPFTSVL